MLPSWCPNPAPCQAMSAACLSLPILRAWPDAGLTRKAAIDPHGPRGKSAQDRTGNGHVCDSPGQRGPCRVLWHLSTTVSRAQISPRDIKDTCHFSCPTGPGGGVPQQQGRAWPCPTSVSTQIQPRKERDILARGS